jgi:DNA-directed RNA polymerase specialized sigma subunit
MKLISYQKEIDTVAFLKKQMSSREVVEIVGLSQSKVNRIGRNTLRTLSSQEEVGHKF